MNANAAEVVSKLCFHLISRKRVERLPRRAHYFTDNLGHLAERAATTSALRYPSLVATTFAIAARGVVPASASALQR
jgi:hypothetical protein